MMPFRCFIEVLDGILSLFLVCGKQSFPSPGKVPGISAKTVHFPPWQDGVPASQASLAALGVSTSRGKCREFPQKRFTFPRGLSNADIAFIDKLSFIGKRGMGALE